MFSGNQILDVSGDLKQLKITLDFAVRLSGMHDCLTRMDRPCVLYFQEKGNIYLLKLGHIKDDAKHEIPEGYKEYPFDYDIEIVSRIIEQWLKKDAAPSNGYEGCDGAHDKGFRLRSFWNLPEESRKQFPDGPHTAIAIERYKNYYGK